MSCINFIFQKAANKLKGLVLFTKRKLFTESEICQNGLSAFRAYVFCRSTLRVLWVASKFMYRGWSPTVQMRNTDSASLNRQYYQLLWNIDAPLLSKGNGYNVYSKWNIDIFKGNILCSEFIFCNASLRDSYSDFIGDSASWPRPNFGHQYCR